MENLNSMYSTKTRYLVTASLFAALICLTTAYILHIPVGNGFVHIGDAFIYLGAALLPTPYAMVCAAVGAGLADLITGYAIWMIPTMLIKPVLVLFITSKHKNIINTKNVIGAAVAGCVGWFLYAVAQGIIYGSFTGAFAISIMGLLQPIGSFIAFVLIGITFDKLGMKKKF